MLHEFFHEACTASLFRDARTLAYPLAVQKLLPLLLRKIGPTLGGVALQDSIGIPIA